MASSFGENCKLIVGLGNAGSEFHGTRHNIGFDLVDLLASKHDISVAKSKFKSTYGYGLIDSQPVILVKPKTGMNLSGSSVKEWVKHLGLKLSSILIVHDAADLKLGTVKAKVGGSTGQNGVKDIVKRLGSINFPRLRLGIGRPEKEGTDLCNWVLGQFRSTDASVVQEMLHDAYNCALSFIERGIDPTPVDQKPKSKPAKFTAKQSSSSSEAPVSILIPLSLDDPTLGTSNPLHESAIAVVG